MDLEEIRTFIAVAEELHFGRAAERLHMAQPPVSRTIQRLERDLGAPLFDRTTRAVRLTPAGEALLPVADEILRTFERARGVVEATKLGQVGQVRVAFAGVSTHRRIAELARAVRERSPGIDLQLYSANYADDALQKLVQHDMDLAIGRWTMLPQGVASRAIAAESLVLAVPADHPLASSGTVSFGDLRHESFVSLPQRTRSVTTEGLQLLARRAGFIPVVVQVASDTWTVLTLVSAGIGLAVTVSSVAESFQDQGVAFLPITESVGPIHLSVAWRDDETNAAVQSVLGISTEVLPTIQFESGS